VLRLSTVEQTSIAKLPIRGITMTSANPATLAILTLLSRIRAERSIIEQQMRDQLADFDEQIQAITTTLTLLTEGQEQPLSLSPKATVGDIKSCTSHKVALDRIASIEGSANASAAARLLIQAGLSKSKPRNLTSSLYNLMKSSDEWERVSPGTFERVTLVRKNSPEVFGGIGTLFSNGIDNP